MPKNLTSKLKGINPFCDWIGLNFTKIEKGFSQCVLEVKEKLFNPHKTLHGGVISTMCSTGMGGALYPDLDETELCAAIETKINYFRAVKLGTLTCNSKVIFKGKRTAVLESEIINDGNLVAKAVGTFSIFKIKDNFKKMEI